MTEAEGARRDPEDYSFDEIVALFSEPHVFLRECVQNAIDAQVKAGSTRPIEVTTEFSLFPQEQKPHRPGEGILIVRIVDGGVGMNRRDIDTQLTQLRNTSKTEAREMIGCYGVGFLSVFAFEPSATVVDTGREGES